MSTQQINFTGNLSANINRLMFFIIEVAKELGLSGAASATDAVIHKKMFGLGTTTLIIPNEEINDIMKIVKSLEESGLLIKSVSKTIKNEAKEQKGEFRSMLLGTLGAGS